MKSEFIHFLSRVTDADTKISEKDELDLQLRSVPEIEKRIAELTAA